MHTIVRRYIRTSVAFLIAGLIVGIWMEVARDVLGRYPDTDHITAHTHLILIGFVMGMILGVAQWMFPRPEPGSRYSPNLAMAIYYLFTVSTSLRGLAEVLKPLLNVPWLGYLAMTGGAGQTVAFVLFFYNMWPRVRPLGSQFREARGEKF
ncbi:MAG: cbb3-type cytochrome c oxidase subunit I [candidate division KSB1 bacterium]|nr:cbb3-type cytochrome c oxidase subunit I [candidate division KSB1 bacterium]